MTERKQLTLTVSECIIFDGVLIFTQILPMNLNQKIKNQKRSRYTYASCSAFNVS